MSLLQEIQRHPDATVRFSKEMQRCGAYGELEALYASGAFSRVILTGTASGLFACEAACSLLRQAGIPAYLADAADLRGREAALITDDSLIFAVICSSGEWDTAKLCLDLQKHPGLVTFHACRSTVSRCGRVRISLADGSSCLTPVTAYTNACAALWAAVHTLTRGAKSALRDLGERLAWYGYIQEGYAFSGMSKTMEIAGFLQGVKQVTLVASDLSSGTAKQAALLLRETAPFGTGCASLREFIREPHPECAVFFDFSENERELVERMEEWARDRGCRTVIVTNRDLPRLSRRVSARMGSRDPEASPLCAIVPMEMLAAFYADGRDVFENVADVCPGGK